MIVSLGTGMGLKKAIREKIVGFSGHITISQYDINNSFERAPIELDSALTQEIKSIPGVVSIQAFGTKAGILKGPEDFEGTVLKGVDKNYNATFFKESIVEGNWPTLQDSARNDSVLVSAILAKRLKLKLHDAVNMYFIQEAPRPPRIRKFYICGIYSTGLEEFDKTFLIGDLYHLKRLNNWQNNEVGGFEILLNNIDQLELITSQVRAELPYDLDAQSVKSNNEQLFHWLDLFDLNIYMILVIMIAVAVINMVSALLILIVDRTNMIGLLKALGGNNKMVISIFLYQSGAIIFRGMFWGNLIGIGICLLQQYFGIVHLDPETYYVSEAPIALNYLYILYLNAGVLVICMITLLLPALMVSKISPIKALRYE